MKLPWTNRWSALGPIFFVFSQSVALAAVDVVPKCWSNKLGAAIEVMNEQVLEWKASSPEQYLDRAKVSGKVTQLLQERKSHTHFEIQIGPDPKDVLEVIYNVEFGRLPKIVPGMEVEACGDYITSRVPTAQYPASPSGALIHWVHLNPKNHPKTVSSDEAPDADDDESALGAKHEDGFVVIDGKLYGDRIHPKTVQ